MPEHEPESEREIVVSGAIDGPRALVFEAFSEAHHLAQWWGPNGFTTTTHAFEFSVGGVWDYTMHGPDGVDYPNIATYYVVEPYKKLVYDHGATDETPALFRVTVTFTETNGRTTMEMISTSDTTVVRGGIEPLPR